MSSRAADLGDPTILRAAWRYKWVVLLGALLFAALGYGVSWIQPRSTQWMAASTLVVEDPRASTLFDRSAQPQGRYVNNQVAILRSAALAEAASALLAQADPPIDLSPPAVLGSFVVIAAGSSDVVEVRFEAPSAAAAIEGANAVIAAYEDVKRAEAARNYSDTLELLDSSIAEVDAQLEELERSIESNRASDPGATVLDRQLEQAVEEFARLQEERRAASATRREAIDERLLQLQLELGTVRQLRALDSQSPATQALLREQSDLLDRRLGLTQRRDQIRLDSELLGSGVLLFSPATAAVPPDEPSFRRNSVLAGMLGLVAGVAAAYYLALRRRTFQSRTEPERVLGVPLLGDVPDFREERVASNFPLADAPFSASAEGFRFAAAALSLQQKAYEHLLGLGGVERNVRSVTLVSTEQGEGKTLCTANTAYAAAEDGARVLMIDADLGHQELSRVVLPHATDETSELDIGQETPVRLREIDVTGIGTLHLLNLESLGTRWPTFFSGENARAAIEAAEGRYDLVWFDVPPLGHIAYVSTLTAMVDHAVAVIRHGSRVSAAEDLRDRLELIGTPLLGYVYTRAPLRPGVSEAVGSLAHLGPPREVVRARRRWRRPWKRQHEGAAAPIVRALIRPLAKLWSRTTI